MGFPIIYVSCLTLILYRSVSGKFRRRRLFFCHPINEEHSLKVDALTVHLLLQVTSTESGGKRILQVKQKKFHSSAEKASTKERQPRWKVPLVIGGAGLKTRTVLMDSAEQSIEIEDGAKASWVLVRELISRIFFFSPIRSRD